MEKITRRTIMKAAIFAGVPAGAVTAFARDPLADVIIEYRAGAATFNAIPIDKITMENENALVEATYGPASDLIRDNIPPATSLRGVTEAIRYALDDGEMCNGNAENALRSALAYLDGAIA